jgi:hypothetical protein
MYCGKIYASGHQAMTHCASLRTLAVQGATPDRFAQPNLAALKRGNKVAELALCLSQGATVYLHAQE